MIISRTQLNYQMNLKKRNQARKSLFQANRHYNTQYEQNLQLYLEDPGLLKSSDIQQKRTIEAPYRIFITKFRATTFYLQDFPTLFRLLVSSNILEKLKSVIGLASLSVNFANSQIRQQILTNQLIPKLAANLTNTQSSFLVLKSIQILKELIQEIKTSEQFDRFVSSQTIQLKSIIDLLGSDYQYVKKSALQLLNGLINKKIKLDCPNEKIQLFRGINNVVDGCKDHNFGQMFNLVFDIVTSIPFSLHPQTTIQIEMTFLIIYKILKKITDQYSYKEIIIKISNQLLTKPTFFQLIIKKLKIMTPKELVRNHYYFVQIFTMTYFQQPSEKYPKKCIIWDIPLKKYLSHPKAYKFLLQLDLINRIKISLYYETRNNHSEDWKDAISSLTIIEYLLQSQYSIQIQAITTDSYFYLKLQQLYLVQNENLRNQLNRTTTLIIVKNQQIKLINYINQCSLIRLYFSSLELFGKNTNNMALSKMKYALKTLKAKQQEQQSRLLYLLIRQQICKFEIFSSIVYTKSRCCSAKNDALVDFYVNLKKECQLAEHSYIL